MTFVSRTPVAGDKIINGINPSNNNAVAQFCSAVSSAVNPITGKTIYTFTVPIGPAVVVDQDNLVLHQVTTSGLQHWAIESATSESNTTGGI